MSEEDKTEEPTEKKLRDSAEEGQTYKFKEIIYLFNVVLVILSLYATDIVFVLEAALVGLEDINVLRRYLDTVKAEVTLLFVIPASVSILSVSLPSLAQSKFVMATKAIKLDFDKLNPVNGFKNLFSMKTVIEAIKAIFVHIFGAFFIFLWFFVVGKIAFEFMHVPKEEIYSQLFDYTVMFIGCVIVN